MNSKSVSIALVLGVLLVGIVLGLHWNNHAVAQQPQGTETHHYQVSAYAGTTPNGVHHGCYIVDTNTGRLWHARAGGQVETVVNQLGE